MTITRPQVPPAQPTALASGRRFHYMARSLQAQLVCNGLRAAPQANKHAAPPRLLHEKLHHVIRHKLAAELGLKSPLAERRQPALGLRADSSSAFAVCPSVVSNFRWPPPSYSRAMFAFHDIHYELRLKSGDERGWPKA
jgi:hypothetical protein